MILSTSIPNSIPRMLAGMSLEEVQTMLTYLDEMQAHQPTDMETPEVVDELRDGLREFIETKHEELLGFIAKYTAKGD